MKNKIDNEKGLTLLEVLLSIEISTNYPLTVMNFFPQMGFMNQAEPRYSTQAY